MREYVLIKVISPNELDPASEKPNGAGILLYLFTKSSDRRNEKTSDIYIIPFKYFIEDFSFLEVLLVYHDFKKKNTPV
jgi:hypothetical protein